MTSEFNEIGAVAAIINDWETYSPMTPAEVWSLIQLIASNEDGRLLHNPYALECWGAQAALGNWDSPTAHAAVHAFYALDPRPVWRGGDEPEAGQPRPVLPGDITRFVEAARANP